MRTLRYKLTYANVVSTLALFLALSGGVAFAATKIHSADIAKGAVKTSKLHGRAVTSGKLSKGAVKTGKLHRRAVTSGKLAIGAVRSNQIAEGAVGSAEIAAGAVGSTQIGTRAVAPSNLQVPLNFVAGPIGGGAVVPAAVEEAIPYPLAGAGWTQNAGQLDVIFGTGTATLAWNGGPEGFCRIRLLVGTNGYPVGGENGGQFQTSSVKPVTIEANLGGLPLIDQSTAQARQLSASVETNGECATGSTVDSTRFRVLGFG